MCTLRVILQAFRRLCDVRTAQALEKARTGRLIGSALEAKVLLHVADPAVRGRLAELDAAPNGADPLRYAFIVSQARFGKRSPVTQSLSDVRWARSAASDVHISA